MTFWMTVLATMVGGFFGGLLTVLIGWLFS